MADQTSGNQPAVPRKPLRVPKPILWVISICVIVYMMYSILSSGSPSKTGVAKNQTEPVSTPTSNSDLNSYDQLQKEKFADLAKKREMLAQDMKSVGITDPTALIEIINQLPPCNKDQREHLNGQNDVAINHQTGQVLQFSCGNDDQWHPIPPQASQIQPLTPEQEHAMRQEPARRANSSGGSGSGESPKERAAAALDAALKSSSVVDFVPQAAATTAPAVAPNLPSPTAPTTENVSQSEADKKPKYPWNSATGQSYHVMEGTVIEAVLTNRIAGELPGPVNVMVTTNLYSRDHQHILMPQGTRVLGETARVSVSGQRRLATPFHRIIMPDGYSVDIAEFTGADRQGATGLTGRVETHWPKLIATAILVGAIGGLSEMGATSTSYNGLTSIRLGIGEQTGQEATQILSHALNVVPTVTVYEGTPVRIWVLHDMELPAYENHTITPTL